ncbi:MAG TPA: hypothetical protein PLU93_11300, partial [Treponemataceae bacterium]|nr:hypothetical protein [Treponemataceae bacterium]
DAAPDEYRQLIHTVALADMMVHYLLESVEYYQIERRLLEQFRFSSEDQFRRVCEHFQNGFEADKSK